MSEVSDFCAVGKRYCLKEEGPEKKIFCQGWQMTQYQMRHLIILFCVGYLCQVFVDEPQRNLALFLVHVVPQQSNYAHEAQETKVVGRLSKSTVNSGIFLSWEEVYLHVLQ